MPVKKTTKSSSTSSKKATTKSSVSKKFANANKKQTIKPSFVKVETKKTVKTTTSPFQSYTGFMKVLFVVLLLLNLVFGILNFTKQNSALKLEEMKVGGPENLEKVMKLYKSDFYKEQQSAAIKQFMAQ